LRIRRLTSHLDIPPWTIKIHCQGVHSKGSASDLALARSYVLAAELATKQHSDAAWVVADRALAAARCSGIPVAVGEVSR
ncbi:hypothetical protein ACFYOH_44775, partial [Streptomyces sp. NPDC007856]